MLYTEQDLICFACKYFISVVSDIDSDTLNCQIIFARQKLLTLIFNSFTWKICPTFLFYYLLATIYSSQILHVLG